MKHMKIYHMTGIEIYTKEVGIVTNYERIKNMSVEEMAVSIMCPYEIGMMDKKRCDEGKQNDGLYD